MIILAICKILDEHAVPFVQLGVVGVELVVGVGVVFVTGVLLVTGVTTLLGEAGAFPAPLLDEVKFQML